MTINSAKNLDEPDVGSGALREVVHCGAAAGACRGGFVVTIRMEDHRNSEWSVFHLYTLYMIMD